VAYLDIRSGDAKEEISRKVEMSSKRKPMHRVNLEVGPGLTTSVFIKAKNRPIAERRALRRYKGAHVVRSPLPPV
jgi:hypothetical protein